MNQFICLSRVSVSLGNDKNDKNYVLLIIVMTFFYYPYQWRPFGGLSLNWNELSLENDAVADGMNAHNLYEFNQFWNVIFSYQLNIALPYQLTYKKRKRLSKNL